MMACEAGNDSELLVPSAMDALRLPSTDLYDARSLLTLGRNELMCEAVLRCDAAMHNPQAQGGVGKGLARHFHLFATDDTALSLLGLLLLCAASISTFT